MPATDTFAAVRACSMALLRGAVLQAEGISAGRGALIDWRTVKSGETLQEGGDAFDTAQLFVGLVGVEAALARLEQDDFEPEPVPPAPRVAPKITAFRPNEHGMRIRQFIAPGGFKVSVDPDYHGDAHTDEQAAAFTARLADLAEGC